MKGKSDLMQAIYPRNSLSGSGEAMINGPGQPISLRGAALASSRMRPSA